MNKTIPSPSNGSSELKNVGVLEMFMYQVDGGTFFIKEATRFAPFAKYDKEVSTISNGDMVDYGKKFEVSLSSDGDYLLHAYVEVELGAVKLAADNTYGATGRIGYVSNIGHHLFKSISLNINGVDVATLDGRFLDANVEFMSEGSKYDMYMRGIGNNLDINATNVPRKTEIPEVRLLIPLPFFFGRDSGCALPIATLIHSTKSIKFVTRNWNEVLMLENANDSVSCSVTQPEAKDLEAIPVIKSFKLKCDYANVTNYELGKIGCITRTMLIEQPVSHEIKALDEIPDAKKIIEFDAPVGAIKTMFFSVVNTTHPNILHNYRVGCPVTHSVSRFPEGNIGPAISSVKILHGDVERVPDNSYEFYSVMQPMWYGTRGPALDKGLCMYSFTLKPNSPAPSGTSNPGTNKKKIKFELTPTKYMDEAYKASPTHHKETFGFSLVTVSFRLARIREGKFDLLADDGKFRVE